MNCPVCGEAYDELTEFGESLPVAHLPTCNCPPYGNPPNIASGAAFVGGGGGGVGVGGAGGVVSSSGWFTGTFTTAAPHINVDNVESTGRCTECDDVVPTKWLRDVDDTTLCPVCYQAPGPSVTDMVLMADDLKALEAELRPTSGDD